MTAEIISVGTELLIGSILNTNARFLAEELAKNAINVYRQTTVGDNPSRIIHALESAVGRSDLVVVSGGLGPTEDDITAKSLALFLKKPLVFHKPTYQFIQKRLKTHQRGMDALAARQCYIPQGAKAFQNYQGTAPGILYEMKKSKKLKWILLLPGPPRELEPLFLKQILPALRKRAKMKREVFLAKSFKIAGLAEVDVAIKVKSLLRMKPPHTVGIYARPGQVELKIMAKSATQKEAQRMIRSTEKVIRKKFPKTLFGCDDETLGSAVGDLLKKRKKTLSLAESCTGGLVSNLITETPGSSDYYLGGVVSYSNAVKTSQLSIGPALLKKYGAVSAPIAKQMAQNSRKLFGSDFSVGITGIAGPSGGARKKPVGLVYIAVASAKGISCQKHHFAESRTEIKSRAANTALNMLRLILIS